MYQVFAFYTNLGIKIRVTEYRTKRDAYEYVSGLRMCDTPYAIAKNYKVFEVCECGGFTREQMASMIWEEL